MLTVLRTNENREPQAPLAVAEAGGLSHLGFQCHLTWSCPTKLYPTQLLEFTYLNKRIKTHRHEPLLEK